MVADVAVIAIGCLLIGVVVPAVRHKLLQRERFTAALNAYQLLPEGLVATAVWVLVLAEVLLVLALVVSPPAGMLGAVALFGLYGCAIALNIARGRHDIDCGCGDEPTPLSWRILLRNVVLVGLALLGAYLGAPALSVGVVVVGVAMGVATLFLYFAFEQLIANAGRHQRLWQGAT